MSTQLKEHNTPNENNPISSPTNNLADNDTNIISSLAGGGTTPAGQKSKTVSEHPRRHRRIEVDGRLTDGESLRVQSSERLPGRYDGPSRRIMCTISLPRLHNSTWGLFLMSLLIDDTDATPGHLFVLNNGMKSFMSTLPINMLVFFLAAASTIRITQVSIEKRIQQRQSNLPSYLVLIVAIGLASFVLGDVEFDTRREL